MKSLSNLSSHRSGCCVRSVNAVPLGDKHLNSSRKFVTEFIDVGGHVIIGSRIGVVRLQALQLLQGFGEGRQRAHGGGGAIRPAARVLAHGFHFGQFGKDKPMQPGDGVGQRWRGHIVCLGRTGPVIPGAQLLTLLKRLGIREEHDRTGQVPRRPYIPNPFLASCDIPDRIPVHAGRHPDFTPRIVGLLHTVTHKGQ
jgi:hypothetical protein